MITLITIIHIVVSIFMVLVVLLQAGKGASVGATFGGSSQTIFGSRGAGTFLSRLTTAAAIIFMISSLSLSYLSKEQSAKSVVDTMKQGEPKTPPSGQVEDKKDIDKK
ncbi:MAG: preprotein translocase subunit SecG [Nitrospirae bacterium]|nr:preprotein translocase subunit SecG [Nitrospirota bacterium]